MSDIPSPPPPPPPPPPQPQSQTDSKPETEETIKDTSDAVLADIQSPQELTEYVSLLKFLTLKINHIYVTLFFFLKLTNFLFICTYIYKVETVLLQLVFIYLPILLQII